MSSGCIDTQIGSIRAAAHQGDLAEARQQLTEMLRCAGQLSCRDAVSCSDQAVVLLRNIVLPGEGKG